ncbi:MAG: histidinol-phosphatase [Oscillospiraceae bacterium]|nr:histidinol-phosphatase [Oscillospiraceae bacterium]
MTLRNYHTHTVWCDGKHTVDEMAQAAVSQGLQALGFSGHSYTAFDKSCCMALADIPRYVAGVQAARTRYQGQLEVYLGVEDDLLGTRPDFPRDYTIGSVHCLYRSGAYHVLDYKPAVLLRAVETAYGGDFYRLTADYFEALARLPDVTGCEIVGHFDLVTKFNEGGRLFDEDDPRYWKPALEVLEALCRRELIFEINTGAMSRGYRTAPYPSRRFLEAIRAFGGAVQLSSDCHSAGTLSAYFPEAAALASSCGFRTVRVLTPGGWQDEAL